MASPAWLRSSFRSSCRSLCVVAFHRCSAWLPWRSGRRTGYGERHQRSGRRDTDDRRRSRLASSRQRRGRLERFGRMTLADRPRRQPRRTHPLPVGDARRGRRARLLEAMLGAARLRRSSGRVFAEPGTPDVENLYARARARHPHLMFAGHTDVVPPGDEAAWTHPPFAAEIADGELYRPRRRRHEGRHRLLRRGGARHRRDERRPKGSISLLITGDEEGPAINGTVKLLEWAAAQRRDAGMPAIVGEPTNPDALGDMIKIGRRGSLSGTRHRQRRAGPRRLSASRRQPGARADAHWSTRCCIRAVRRRARSDFQPTNLEVTTIDVGNPATNVIPAKATRAFNIRFNDHWTAETVAGRDPQPARRRRAAQETPAGETPVDYELAWRDRPSHGLPDPRRHADRHAGGGDRGRDRQASRRCRPPAAPRMRASSRTTARWSSSGWSARPCTWSTSASRSPTWRR